MSLQPGTRLGPYEITAQIGVGGMGKVYRATDTNLKRSVAIKVLPESVAGDPERLARFQREAEVLASLNHPGIAAIYGLERTEGSTALVMEVLEGPTLADRIAQGAIPVDEALPIAKQIAEALEAADEQGIIHRDLKPANIKLRPDGTVKVLDFGLAKAMEPVGDGPVSSQSPTITAMTEPGVLLGTAPYMSPEQVRGRAVDRRTDIWAFGCVLYEMLVGKRPFIGDDVSETLAQVIDREPDWTVLPPALPPALVVFIRRCLQKTPETAHSRRRRRALGTGGRVRDSCSSGIGGRGGCSTFVAATPARGSGCVDRWSCRWFCELGACHPLHVRRVPGDHGIWVRGRTGPLGSLAERLCLHLVERGQHQGASGARSG